ncbi:MAG: 3-deoxy-manno-octulosonate cytidylyltransferase, partial [Planctomycetota bacterium JB042]
MSGLVAAVIPARIGSTRLPRKPLLDETGRPLVCHVVDRVRRARRIGRVIVATDSEEIVRAVEADGGEARMTSPAHRSGTDRMAEVARDVDAAGFVNVQGDEPDLDPDDLDRVAGALLDDPASIWTLAVRIEDEETWRDPHAVKVVLDGDGRALYFTRNPAPYADRFDDARARGLAWKHLGVYGYPRELLFRFTALPPAPLEECERLEQLRAMHHGLPIR